MLLSHLREDIDPEPSERLLLEGETCWKRVRAARASFLIDGAAYYAALASAIERARRSIVIVGWDFHSRARLRRDAAADDPGEGFLEHLNRAAQRRRRLRVAVLGWDYAPLYWFEREFLPLRRLALRGHRRVRFQLDACHPVGASHHQKIAVIDDEVAFCGGLDVTACRWDTPEHALRDARRCDPGFGSYAPFHDVQMTVSGEAAAALGALVRERWWRATGERLRPVQADWDPWPAGLVPDLADVEVGISRTEPAYAGLPEVREVEALYCRALRAARRHVYAECQYLTSTVIGECIAERLREPNGPEFVIVAPAVCSGWLEEATMGVLRARLIAQLQAADRFGRLRLYYPVLPGSDPGSAGCERTLNVHSKLLIVDDQFARIGSSNLSNRSLGLDSECDLALEACGDARSAAAIAGLRARLLAEHLGCAPEELDAALRQKGSLIDAVESLRGGQRTLAPLRCETPEWVHALLPQSVVWDPERPAAIDAVLSHGIARPARSEAGSSHGWGIALAALGVAALCAAWVFTPLASALTPERIAASVEGLRHGPAGPLLGLLGFVGASVLAVPVTLLTATAGLLFGWALGSAIALAGSLASAVIAYGIGRLLWRDWIQRVSGRRLYALNRALARRGLLAVAALRIVPVAPFVVVNLVAGATRVRLSHFAFGTVLAMAPGTIAIALFADRALLAWQKPGPLAVAGASACLLALCAGALGVRRWFARRAVEAQRVAVSGEP